MFHLHIVLVRSGLNLFSKIAQFELKILQFDFFFVFLQFFCCHVWWDFFYFFIFFCKYVIYILQEVAFTLLPPVAYSYLSNTVFIKSLKKDFGLLKVWGFSSLFPSNVVPQPAVNHLLYPGVSSFEVHQSCPCRNITSRRSSLTAWLSNRSPMDPMD